MNKNIEEWIKEKKNEYKNLYKKRIELKDIKNKILDFEFTYGETPHELYEKRYELEVEIEYEEEKLKLECIDKLFLDKTLICIQNSEDRLKLALRIAYEILDYVNELYREECEYKRMGV